MSKKMLFVSPLCHTTQSGGAAGGVVLLAELAHHRNFLSSVDPNPTPLHRNRAWE